MHIATGSELPPDLSNFVQQEVARCRQSELRSMREAAWRWAAMLKSSGG
jgi:hypothetical protein